MNCGIRVTCVGSIIVANTIRNTLSRPRQRKREKAYAARLLESIMPTTLVAVTKTVFRKKRG